MRPVNDSGGQAKNPARPRILPHARRWPRRLARFRPGTRIADRSADATLQFLAEVIMIALNQILVATDFSEPSDAACAYGRELAGRFGATLHVLHVVQGFPPAAFGAEGFSIIGPELQRQMEDDARHRLEELVMDSDDSGPATTTAVITDSSPAFAIIEYAKAHRIDAIVVGTHGRGALAHLLMGSVAERVVRLAPCPVLTVKSPERDFVHPDALVTAAGA